VRGPAPARSGELSAARLSGAQPAHPLRYELAGPGGRRGARSGHPPGDHQPAIAPPEVAHDFGRLSGLGLDHRPDIQILCVSYAQDFADKLSRDCRRVVASDCYRHLSPARLSPRRQADPSSKPRPRACRLATSVGGVLTGRGADIIIIDDPLKPEEALSDSHRRTANEWFGIVQSWDTASKATELSPTQPACRPCVQLSIS
jgi:hypothetical protein